MRIIFFVVASLVVMTVDHRYSYLEKVHWVLSAIIYPIQYVTNLPAIASSTTEIFKTRKLLITENAQMRKEQLILNAKIQKIKILESENRNLRELLQSSEQLDDRVLIASLLSIDLRSFRHQVEINKGSNAGVYAGQPIIDAHGMMGQVIHVGPFSSTALLLTDPSHAIPVQINRNGLRMIAVGIGESHILQLEHLPNNADIKEGDLIISSGLGDRFPAGYPVGVVNSIKSVSGEPFSEATIILSAQLVKNKEVLLVWPEVRSTVP